MKDAQWFYESEGSRIGPITAADMTTLLHGSVIVKGTSVWCTGMSEWTAVESTQLFQTLLDPKAPVIYHSLSNRWLWLLIASPLVWLAVDTDILNGGLILGWLMNIVLVTLDARALEKAGSRAPSRWWSLLVPIYLLRRCMLNKTSYTPLIMWLILSIGPDLISVLTDATP